MPSQESEMRILKNFFFELKKMLPNIRISDKITSGKVKFSIEDNSFLLVNEIDGFYIKNLKSGNKTVIEEPDEFIEWLNDETPDWGENPPGEDEERANAVFGEQKIMKTLQQIVKEEIKNQAPKTTKINSDLIAEEVGLVRSAILKEDENWDDNESDADFRPVSGDLGSGVTVSLKDDGIHIAAGYTVIILDETMVEKLMDYLNTL